MPLIDEVIECAQANARAFTGHHRTMWTGIAEDCIKVREQYEQQINDVAKLDLLAKAHTQHESDAKVIADLRSRLDDAGYPLGEIDGLMKVIAALREALVCAAAMLEESGSGYIPGSRSDTEWDKDRALVIETVKAALAVADEQTAGEKSDGRKEG